MAILAAQFKKALATNATSTSFTAPTVSATEPSGATVIDLCNRDLGWGLVDYVPPQLQFVFYGTTTADTTFDLRVYGYNKVADVSLWIPQLLVDVSATLSTIAATALGASTLLVDTLTVNDGAADSSEWRSLVDCQEDLPASLIVHTRGCRYLAFDGDLTGAVSMNALMRPLY